MNPQTASRNLTYRQLRAPARQGTYTVGQLVGLAASGLLALGIGAALLRLGAPAGLALSAGVLMAGSLPMAALALEGREFSIPGLLHAIVSWQRSPREYAPQPGTRGGSYHVPADTKPRARSRPSRRRGRR